ncbi:segregation and condensation protein B [Clostridia bacterium]|nr:segregation and condensation protein B [Clostridia bacterium]
MKLSEAERAAEAILFAFGEPVEIKVIAASLSLSADEAKAVVTRLADYYEAEGRGIKIIQVGEAYQMCTSPLFYNYVRTVNEKASAKKLSPTVIETLAIIAYKQPVSKAQIEEIRGVDATHAVNRLMESGLVCEKGRADSPGRAILFGTTDEFLRHFGFSGLSRLPDLNDENLLNNNSNNS